MRIGIDIRELERGKATGIGRYLRNFIAYVERARPQHEVILYGNQHSEAEWPGSNVRTRIALERWTQWWDQVTLPGMANADGIEVFLSPYIKGPMRVRCPLVVTIHDLMDLVFPEYSRGPVARMLFRQMARRVGLRADVVLADSQHSAEDIVRLLQLPREKIEVLPIGIEERYGPQSDDALPSALRDQYGISGEFIFYLGNFRPHKNVRSLIEVYADLPAPLRARFQLVLGGRLDPSVDEHRRCAMQCGVGEQVRFIGPVDECDMPALYGAAALFVFPSLYEGFGLPPLEAMACGTAVLCSNRTSLPEVVGDGGVLFDPDDRAGWQRLMGAMLADDSERSVWGQKGLQRARAFRVEALCERQMQLLESVGQGRG